MAIEREDIAKQEKSDVVLDASAEVAIPANNSVLIRLQNGELIEKVVSIGIDGEPRTRFKDVISSVDDNKTPTPTNECQG